MEKGKLDFEETYQGFRLQGYYFRRLTGESKNKSGKEPRARGYLVDADGTKKDYGFSVMGIVYVKDIGKKGYRKEEAAKKDQEMIKKQMREQTRAEVEERIDEGNYEDHEFEITLPPKSDLL